LSLATVSGDTAGQVKRPGRAVTRSERKKNYTCICLIVQGILYGRMDCFQRLLQGGRLIQVTVVDD